MVRELILLLVLLQPQRLECATWEVSKNDARIPTRSVQFVDEIQTSADRGTYRTISPPVGEWSQPIRCPENDKAGAIKHSGELFIMMPGGATILEANDFPDGNQSISSWGMLFGERDFKAAAITEGATFSIQCPINQQIPTHYSYIESFSEDGYLELPSCTNNGNVINCRVLHPNMIDDMNTRNWQLSNMIADQRRKAFQNNEQVDDRLAEARNKKIMGMLPTIVIIGLIVAGVILAIGAAQRRENRQNRRR